MDSFITKLNVNVFNPIIGLMVTIAIAYFIYGIIEFVMGADNEDKREQGKQHMIWGIVGLFIMISVFGLINILGNFVESVK